MQVQREGFSKDKSCEQAEALAGSFFLITYIKHRRERQEAILSGDPLQSGTYWTSSTQEQKAPLVLPQNADVR